MSFRTITLSILVLVWLVVGIGYWKKKVSHQSEAVRRTTDQEATLRVIELMRGRYFLAEDLPGKPVIAVHLSGKGINNLMMEQLTVFPALRYLNLTGTSISDEGLVHLKLFSRLRKLNISGSAVRDEGL